MFRIQLQRACKLYEDYLCLEYKELVNYMSTIYFLEHKQLVSCMSTIYEICSEKIKEAIERDKIDNSLQVM